jgi:hypothetical protein
MTALRQRQQRFFLRSGLMTVRGGHPCRSVLTVLAATAAALTGCGSQTQTTGHRYSHTPPAATTSRPSRPPPHQVAVPGPAGTRVKRFLTASTQGNGRAACAQLTARAQREITHQAGRPGASPCATLLRRPNRALRGARVTRIAGHANIAFVTVRLSKPNSTPGTFRLIRTAKNQWKIDGIPGE